MTLGWQTCTSRPTLFETRVMRGAFPSPMLRCLLNSYPYTVTRKLFRARIHYQFRTLVAQMSFPFPAFSTAEQKRFLSQSAWRLEYLCCKALNSLQIRLSASNYPSQFEEPVAEGISKEGGRWLSLPACAGPVATGEGAQRREQPEGGPYVTPLKSTWINGETMIYLFFISHLIHRF